MSWSSVAPDGSQAVKANRSILDGNTTYTETKLKLDHYWNEDANNDGHHKKIEMPNALVDPSALSTGMNIYGYCRDKTVAESATAQKSEPFIYSQVGAVNHYLQLGFRAMLNFSILNVSPFTITTLYSHNCSVARTGIGTFTLTFTNPLPTSNYVVFGNVLTSSGDPAFIAAESGTKLSSMTDTIYKFTTFNGDNVVNPIMVCLAVCGG